MNGDDHEAIESLRKSVEISRLRRAAFERYWHGELCHKWTGLLDQKAFEVYGMHMAWDAFRYALDHPVTTESDEAETIRIVP